MAALLFYDLYAIGVSYYGVANLQAMAELTHKFKSRYLVGLVGPLPAAASVYQACSPAAPADGIDVPLLILQGSEDRAVPAD